MPADAYEIETAHPTARPPVGVPRAGAATAGGGRIAVAATVALCLLHVAAIWVALGGRDGITSDWPPLLHDHGFQFHHGITTGTFLKRTGTTAGYDPSFMGGYAMSVVSGQSTTITALAMLAAPGQPAQAYKVGILLFAGATPWLVALAASLLGARPAGVAFATLLFVIYYWTDAAAGYTEVGMVPYLVSVPLGLVAVAGVAAYLNRGGFARWAWASAGCAAVFLAHPTSPMLVAPAGALAYVAAVVRARREGRGMPAARHLGLWAMIPVVLMANAFWYVPGFALLGTMGPPGLYPFAHPEPVLGRVAEIFWNQGPVEPIVLGLALIGLTSLARRDPVAAWALGGFLVAGFAWGYLAGVSRALDVLQPGRHTYACFAAACVASGFGLAEVLARLRTPPGPRLDLAFGAVLLIVGFRVFGPGLEHSARLRLLAPVPFLTSDPPPGAVAMVDSVRRVVAPGERILYEESGLGDGVSVDPYKGRHLSVLLPRLAGVEVIGGPYLHMALATNFAQFGEGKIFGSKDWGRGHFERYARLYRPSAIVCWSREARQFCRSNPDLIRIVEDGAFVLVGRVVGFGGATIRGTAEVETTAGRLVVRDAKPGPDGLVVLRYHAVPYLRATPATAIEPVFLEADPVPFIGLRPTAPGPITIELVAPPATWLGR